MKHHPDRLSVRVGPVSLSGHGPRGTVGVVVVTVLLVVAAIVVGAFGSMLA